MSSPDRSVPYLFMTFQAQMFRKNGSAVLSTGRGRWGREDPKEGGQFAS